LKHMVAQGTGGALISITSVDGINSAAFHASYGAAKAGLIHLTKTFAEELGQYGIRVNSVAPGNVRRSERTRPTRIPAMKRSTRRGAIRHGPNSRIFPLTGSADRGPSAVDRNNLRRDEASTVADEEDQYRSQVRIGVAIVRPQFFIRRRETSCTEREPARKQFC
jgi:NAD(P)-dependent dehydrogenase (short-subunit alcohol dehydrogenase family)